MGRIGNGVIVALATPGSLLAGGLAVVLLIAFAGEHPLWPYERLNLSEAAAVRDAAEVVRLLESGEDPNAPRAIRAGFLFDREVRMTALEAAVASQDAEVVGRVLEHGARMDADLWNRLRCLAEDEEVAALLDAQRPAGAAAECRSERQWR